MGKADCKKNMEENGNDFTKGILCAGGNGKGSCRVNTNIFIKLSFQIIPCFESKYSQGDSGGALTSENGVLVGLVSAGGAKQCAKVNLST